MKNNAFSYMGEYGTSVGQYWSYDNQGDASNFIDDPCQRMELEASLNKKISIQLQIEEQIKSDSLDLKVEIPDDPPAKFRPQLVNYSTSTDIGKNPIVSALNMAASFLLFELPLPKTSFIG